LFRPDWKSCCFSAVSLANSISTLWDNSSITAKRFETSTCFAWCSEAASLRNRKSENYDFLLCVYYICAIHVFYSKCKMWWPTACSWT
jgi:hypothetical protein